MSKFQKMQKKMLVRRRQVFARLESVSPIMYRHAKKCMVPVQEFALKNLYEDTGYKIIRANFIFYPNVLSTFQFNTQITEYLWLKIEICGGFNRGLHS